LNPDVDGYTKTLYHRKILRKTQKTTVLKTIRILKPKHKLSGCPISTLSLPGGTIRPLAPPSATPLPRVLYIFSECFVASYFAQQAEASSITIALQCTRLCLDRESRNYTQSITWNPTSCHKAKALHPKRWYLEICD